MYEIILDTETTGLKMGQDRVIELAVLKLKDRCNIGEFSSYVNPQNMLVSPGAYQIHKISDQFLTDKPVFGDILDDFLKFIGKHPLVIHNASFDLGMLNYELSLLGKPNLSNPVIDTLKIARSKGFKGTLDSLCDRFKVDRAVRGSGHGAMIDIKLLWQVYNEMCPLYEEVDLFEEDLTRPCKQLKDMFLV